MLDLEAQLARYGDVIEAAADALVDRRAVMARRDEPAHPRRRRVLLVAAVVVVLAIAALGATLLLQPNGSTSGRSIVADGGGRGVIVDVPLPEGVPADWKTVEYDGVRVSVPPTWKLLDAGECPGRADTILTGAAGRHCAAPKDGTWVWLAPASLASASDRRNCGDSTFGALPVCLVLPAKGDDPIVRALMDGTDSLYVAGSGARTPEAPIHPSLRPVDASRVGSAPTMYGAALDFMDAYLTADCAEVEALADRSYSGRCPQVSALVGADGSPPKVARSASTQGYDPNDGYVRLYFDDTHAYQLRLRHQWSSEQQRAVWKAVSVQAADPTEAWPTGGPIGAPACVPVSDHEGRVAGCMRASDMYANGDPHEFEAHLAEQTARYGGTPVYASARSDKIVGVMAPSENGGLGLGFVPLRLVERIPELQACTDTWFEAVKAGATPQVSASCRTLMRAYGLSDARIDGRG